MSQSPTTAELLSREAGYFRSWNALGELVKRGSSFSGRERNCVFLNTGSQRPFADVSSVTGMDFQDDGRCLGLLDWDLDGDQDLWLINRTSPRVRVLRNDWANANRYVSIKLEGVRSNRDAVGARVELELEGGQRIVETVRAGDGFLTQSTKWLNFGVNQAESVRNTRVRWPGDAEWQEFPMQLATNRRYKIVQGGMIEELPRIKSITLADARVPARPTSLPGRVVLTSRVAVTQSEYLSFDGAARSLSDHRSKPLLVNLWASWCSPCIQELGELSKRSDELLKANVTFLPLCVDTVHDEEAGLEEAMLLTRKLLLETTGVASQGMVSDLTNLLSWIFYRHRPLPLPCSFLLDAEGRLAVVYRGRVSADQIIADVRLLEQTTGQLVDSEFPGEGQFLFPEPGINPLLLVRSYRESGYPKDAKELLLSSIDEAQRANARHKLLVPLFQELSMVEAELGNKHGVVEACREAAKLAPDDPMLAISLAVALANQGQRADAAARLSQLGVRFKQPRVQRSLGQAWLAMKDAKNAAASFAEVLKTHPDDSETRFQLATCEQVLGNLEKASTLFEQVLARDPVHVMAANNLAWIFATSEEAAHRSGVRAVQLAKKACELTKYQSPVFLGTLSAAFAEARDFDQAIQVGEQAIALAKARGQRRLAADLEKRLGLHRRQMPYRDR